MNPSESWNVSYYVTNNSTPLKVTLVWTDYKGTLTPDFDLINDLDLVVTGPSGSYLGNGGDTINNVEQVELSSPLLGKYNIRINGTNIPQGPQPFALVISGGVSDVYGYVVGFVKDNVSKAGIEGAIISTGSGTINITNESGFYSLFLEEGVYDLNVTGDFEYYSNSSVTVEVLPDFSIVQDIELVKKPTGNISGIIINV